MTKEVSNFANKTHGNVAALELMLKYLPARLALEDGKTNIGDIFIDKNNSRLVAYRIFMLVLPFEP